MAERAALVTGASGGIGAALAAALAAEGFGVTVSGRDEKRHVDLQLDLNLRAAILLFRACLPLLRAAVADAGRAQVIQVSSAAGKQGQPGLSVYSAAKFGLVGFTEACNRDHGAEGIRSTVFCPGLVDTPLAAAYDVSPEEMVRPEDLAEALRFLLRLSDRCLVPELSFLAPEGRFGDF